ncbi:hypothetical protein [Synechococcus sp. PCC 7336]|nr:hypothetical protein [Synechococcus sp. PCC 7336]
MAETVLMRQKSAETAVWGLKAAPVLVLLVLGIASVGPHPRPLSQS